MAKAELIQDIITSIAGAISRHDPKAEIRDMFVESHAFRHSVAEWKDPETNLSILQLAVTKGNLDVVRFLQRFCSWPSNTINLTIGGRLYKAEVNSLFLLACKVGAVDIIRCLLEQAGDPESSALMDTPGVVLYPDNKVQRGEGHQDCDMLRLPFEVAVDAKQADCAVYLMQWIIRQTFKKADDILKAPVWHQTCHVGAAGLLELLVQNRDGAENRKWLMARDVDDSLALHVAAGRGEADCLETLLKHGAPVSATAKCRSALHILYYCRENPERLPRCTEVLVRHGVNVNALDHNCNTPMDSLAYEIGRKPHEEGRELTSRYRFTRQGTTGGKEAFPATLTLEGYRAVLLRTMEILLRAGAWTVIYGRRGVVEHTIAHTLLQNTNWPVSNCLFTTPMDVYNALKLLFAFGCDPNVLAKHNLTSSFTTILISSLHEIRQVALKCSYVFLFIRHGADLDHLIPPPRHFRKHQTDRIWTVHPVLLALQEKHPMEVIELLVRFTSQRQLNASFRCRQVAAWQSLLSRLPPDEAYTAAWRALRRRIRREVRSLKHCCKGTILKCMDGMADRSRHLPVPKAVLAYLVDSEC